MLRISGATAFERALMRKVERACFKAAGQKNFFVTDVAVVDEATIKQFNSAQRGVDSVTDVLSFPCLDKPTLPLSQDSFNACDRDGRRVLLGSVMICRQRAEDQAREFGHSYARELGFLICHGLLHLLGFDHIDQKDEEIMTSLQREIMQKVGLKRNAD